MEILKDAFYDNPATDYSH